MKVVQHVYLAKVGDMIMENEPTSEGFRDLYRACRRELRGMIHDIDGELWGSEFLSIREVVRWGFWDRGVFHYETIKEEPVLFMYAAGNASTVYESIERY